jgi:hypothetical protein
MRLSSAVDRGMCYFGYTLRADQLEQAVLLVCHAYESGTTLTTVRHDAHDRLSQGFGESAVIAVGAERLWCCSPFHRAVVARRQLMSDP